MFGGRKTLTGKNRLHATLDFEPVREGILGIPALRLSLTPLDMKPFTITLIESPHKESEKEHFKFKGYENETKTKFSFVLSLNLKAGRKYCLTFNILRTNGTGLTEYLTCLQPASLTAVCGRLMEIYEATEDSKKVVQENLEEAIKKIDALFP
jgi:hypothetical protein